MQAGPYGHGVGMSETPPQSAGAAIPADGPADSEDGLGGRPPEDDEPDSRQDVAPDSLAAGDTGWSAIAVPGSPDGEVDTRS